MTARILLTHNVAAPYRLPLFQALAERYDLTVQFCAESERGRKWNPQLDDYSFHYVIPYGSRIGGLRAGYSVLKTLRGCDYDIVILSDTPEAIVPNIIASVFARWKGIPYLVWTEVIESTEGRTTGQTKLTELLSSQALNLIRTGLYRGAAGFIAYSSQSKDYLIRRGIEEEIIESGIQVMPEEVIARESEPMNGDSETTTILFVGYLNPRKGVDRLIEAYQRAAVENSELVIVGTGPDENRLRSIAGNREDITFTGYVSEEQKANYYATADVFVLPTLHDAWGLVVNEAIHFGLPVVVTAAAGASELVERYENGFVIKSDDTYELANRLRQLINGDGLRDKFVKRSAEVSEVTDISVGISPFETAINRVLD